MAAAYGDYELFDSPTDGISSLHFSQTNSDLLLATSWDSSVYLYSVSGNRTKAKLSCNSALLDGCFGTNEHIAFAGGLSKTVHRIDMHHYRVDSFAGHEEAIKTVNVCSETDRVFSGSWDKTVKAWDERQPSAPTANIRLPDKVYSVDLQKHLLLVAMANRHIYLYDTRSPLQPVQRRESSLKHQTRCARLFPDASQYICTSIEGRVGVEWVDPSESSQSRKYAFKCHRWPCEDGELVYPVNTAAIHPVHLTFATGGADGFVCVWDGLSRKRVKQFTPKYPSSISALAFSPDGQMLAIASSYGFEEGEKEYSFCI